MINTIGNLYTLLNNTGLQAKDNATYLLLKGILDGLTGINTDYATLSGNPPNIFTGTNSFEKIVDLDSGQLHFPAIQNPSIDVNTLDDYEEGIWTPADVSGAGLVFTILNGSPRYVKIGKLVYLTGFIQFPVNANGAVIEIGGLPFPVIQQDIFGLAVGDNNSTVFFSSLIIASISPQHIRLFDLTGTSLVNSAISGKFFGISGCYIAQN